MKRIPLFYKTDENEKVLSLSTRTDKLGHVSESSLGLGLRQVISKNYGI